MNKLWLSLIVLCLGLGLSACGDDGDSSTPLSSSEKVEQSIVDIPSCMTTPREVASPRTKAATGDDSSVYSLYEGVIESIAAIDEWKGYVVEVVETMESLNAFTSEGTYTDAVTGESIAWGPSDDADYEQMISFYQDDVLGFRAWLTLGDSTAKGRMIWDFSVIEDETNPSNQAMVEVVFDGMAEPKSLEIKATDMNPLDDPEEPENAWVKVTLDSEGHVDLWGNFAFLDLDVTDSGSAEARHYVFAATGYDETVAGAAGNKAIMMLALPLSERDTLTGMWEEDSVSALFYDLIRDMVTNDQLTLLALAGLVDSGTTAEQLTDEEIRSILEFIQAGSSVSSEIDELLFVLDLVNPAYFDETGFVGTFDGENGTLTEVPEGFEDLDISQVMPDVRTPAEVASLNISF